MQRRESAASQAHAVSAPKTHLCKVQLVSKLRQCESGRELKTPGRPLCCWQHLSPQQPMTSDT